MQWVEGNRRRQLLALGAGALAMLALGFVVVVAVKFVFGSNIGALDRIAFHYSDIAAMHLPAEVEDAHADGWDGTIRCILGAGRFYQKATPDGPYPVMLMYSHKGKLLGIQLHSRNQQPDPPWEHMPDGVPKTKVVNVEFEHWRMGVYIVNPASKACGLRWHRCWNCA